jgi:hypothetical protein
MAVAKKGSDLILRRFARARPGNQAANIGVFRGKDKFYGEEQ